MNRISFSQLSRWTSCPLSWKLAYIDKIRISSGNINTIFGKAMHETLQEYLQIMYNQSISDADKIDLNEKLKVKIMSIFKKDCEQADDVLSNTDELIEYYQQGKKILDEFRKYRSKFFKKKFSTLMGIEDEILYQYKTINFYGKLDAVIKEEYNDTLNLRIIDFKTSYSGWNNNKKKDLMVKAQILLYAYFYSKIHNIDIDDISCEYIILKRNVFSGDFFVPRITVFEPPKGKVTLNKVLNKLDLFVDSVFDENGNTKNIDFKPTPSKDACKWCEYKNTKYCEYGK